MSGLHASLHHPVAREWSEPHIHPSNLVYPLFVTLKDTDVNLAGGFEPNKQWGLGDPNQPYASLIEHLKALSAIGLRSVMLFGVVEDKDGHGSMADEASTPVIKVVKILRKELPELYVMCDVCLCEYTDHGHCGVLRALDEEPDMVIDNSKSVARLAVISLAYARAGAHMVCPSDMMDGRVAAIREVLDRNDFNHVAIMAYTSKKASAMYAPFRQAVDSTFSGNRERYQQPVASLCHAKQALRRDESEGATVVLVKPALFYGDIIKEFATTSNLPVACYIVSGEYVMLKGYAESTGSSLESILRESHLGLMRAGASLLITYFTPFLLECLPKW